MRNKNRPYVPYRTAYLCNYGHIEQRRTHRVGEQDARTHEYPNHTDLCQSGRTQIERGYAEPTGTHGIGKLIRLPFPENLSNSVSLLETVTTNCLFFLFQK